MRESSCGSPLWILNGALILAACASAHAAPPAYVYLTSDRLSPAEVFARGIPAPGTDDDVVAHVNGQTCVSASTGFVSVTASETFAHERALYFLVANPRAVVHVFRIRADGKFYGVDASLSDKRYRSVLPQLAVMAAQTRHQQEWLAHRGVPNTHVQAAFSYRRNPATDAIELLAEAHNSDFVDADSRGNTATLVISGTGRDRTRHLTPSFSATSACFVCIGSAERVSRDVAGGKAGEGWCDTFAVSADSRPAQVIDPLSGAKVRRYVPWKTTRQTNYYAAMELPLDCNIVPGTRRLDVLAINCSRLKGANRFSVQIGAGGSRFTWVNSRFDDGEVATAWGRAPAAIPVTGTRYTLRDYGYTTAAVFGGNDSSWWSNVTVMPVYPALPGSASNICLYGEPRNPAPLACFASSVSAPRLHASVNDLVRAISAAEDQRYQVCEHEDFKGSCVILKGSTGVAKLNGLGMSSRISSIRACNKPAPSVWQTLPRNRRGLIGSIYSAAHDTASPRVYFQLRSSFYGDLPTGRQSSADWAYVSEYQPC